MICTRLGVLDHVEVVILLGELSRDGCMRDTTVSLAVVAAVGKKESRLAKRNGKHSEWVYLTSHTR